jgi:predicted amidophosphoribosyltransferase
MGQGARAPRTTSQWIAHALRLVSLHWHRLCAQRFNQAAALAGTNSGISGVPVLHGIIKRMRATPQQVGLSKSERAENVQGAFRVPADQRPKLRANGWC